jgi:DNA-binding LytR/AlgR family response regulator
MNILLAGRNKQELQFLNTYLNDKNVRENQFFEVGDFVKAKRFIETATPHLLLVLTNSNEKRVGHKRYVIAIALSGHTSLKLESLFNDENRASVIHSKQMFTIEEALTALKKFYHPLAINLPLELNQPNRIAIPVKGGYKFMELAEIIRLEGSGSYTILYTINGKKLMVSTRIGNFENQLSKNLFIRTHQSHIVRVTFVRELRKASEYYLVLSNKEKIPVAKRRLSYVEQVLFKSYKKVS